jgi:ribose 5-phosphate isomerase A
MNPSHLSSKQQAKVSAGKAAADMIHSGMIVGLGTGSTAAFFIDFLANRCLEGLNIKAVATSKKSFEQAQALRIPMLDINDLMEIDLTVDGADEIDLERRMIKGGGGALLREKIVANMSREMVVVIDESKAVDFLGAFPLPVEIVSFAPLATIHHIHKLGYQGKLRTLSNGIPFVTDSGNLIYDIQLVYPCTHPKKVHAEIRSIPGVVETGFFFDLARKIIIGNEKGNVKIWTANSFS